MECLQYGMWWQTVVWFFVAASVSTLFSPFSLSFHAILLLLYNHNQDHHLHLLLAPLILVVTGDIDVQFLTDKSSSERQEPQDAGTWLPSRLIRSASDVWIEFFQAISSYVFFFLSQVNNHHPHHECQESHFSPGSSSSPVIFWALLDSSPSDW